MPYSKPSDAPDYVPADKKAQWVEVWNSAYKKAKEDGKSDSDAEAWAFKNANSVTLKDGRSLVMPMEYRYVTELRAEGQGDEIALAGYAALFNSESKDLGGFRETVAPGAFNRSLKEGSDVKALVNHDPNQILGRVKNSTLALSQDDRGLKFRVKLNPKSQAHQDLYQSVVRGDMDECSFAFTVAKGGQQWDEKNDGNDDFYAARTLMDVDLIDVSVVTYPAYANTSVGARALFPEGDTEIRTAIAELRTKKVVPPAATSETRDVDDCYEDVICDVQQALNDKFPTPEAMQYPCGGQYWVCETYPDYVIVRESVSGDYYQIGYHADEVNDGYLFGDPVAVEKNWVPTERTNKALAEYRIKLEQLAEIQKKLSDSAAKDAKVYGEAAALIQKAIEDKKKFVIANGLMDDDMDDYADDFMTEPDSVFETEEVSAERKAEIQAEIRAKDGGKVRTKKVGGKNLTKDKFAYVGDPDKTETWKLPIHDADHVRNALARFNQTEGIPPKEKGKVWNKILAAAKKFDIKVSDTESARALESIPLSETEVSEYRLKLLMLQ